MRTCERCGCYIPDNWTTCPGCGEEEEKQLPVYKKRQTPYYPMKKKQTVYYPTAQRNAIIVYQVKLFYNYEHNPTTEYFGSFGNALTYAKRKVSQKDDVCAAQIINNEKIIYTIRP